MRGDFEFEGVLGIVRLMVIVDLIRVLNKGVYDLFIVLVFANWGENSWNFWSGIGG